MAFEVSVLQFNAGALRCLGLEPNFDLAAHVGIGHDAPLRADVPAEDDADRRLVDQDACPAAFGAVDGSVNDVAAVPRLEYSLGDWRTKQVVFRWLEVSELLGEHRERAVDRGVDDDLPANGRFCLCHKLSSLCCARSSLSPGRWASSDRT